MDFLSEDVLDKMVDLLWICAWTCSMGVCEVPRSDNVPTNFALSFFEF